MKHGFLKIAGMASVLMMLASCNKKEPAPANPEFTLVESSLTVQVSGGSAELVYVVSNPVDGAVVKAESSEDWIHSFSDKGGRMTFIVDANETYEERTADITLKYTYNGGFKQAVAKVIQSAAGLPVLKVTSESVKAPYSGGEYTGTYSLENSAKDGKLSAKADGAWIKNLKVSDGSFSFTVDANKGKEQRNAVITLIYSFGQAREISATLGVSQEAAPEDPVLKITSSTAMNVASDGLSSGVVNYEVVNPAPDGKLTAESKAAWIKLSGNPANGRQAFSVDENVSAQERTGKIAIMYTYGPTGKTLTAEVTVNQNGAEVTPSLIVYANEEFVSAAGGTKEVVIEVENPASDGKYSASSDAEWITINSISSANVNFTVASNGSEAQRSGNVTVKYSYGQQKSVEQTFKVTQYGNIRPVLTLYSDSADFSADCNPGPYNFSYQIDNKVDGGVVGAESDCDWVTVTGTAVPGMIHYKVAENMVMEQRTGHITVKYVYGGTESISAVFTVNQEAAKPEGDYVVTISAEVSGNKVTNIKYSPSDKKHYYFTGNKGQADIVFQSDLDANGQTLEDYIKSKVSSNCINFMMNAFLGVSTPGQAVKYHCTNGNKTPSGFSEEFSTYGFSNLQKSGKAYVWAVQLDPDAADADSTNPYVYKDGKIVIFTLEVNVQ